MPKNNSLDKFHWLIATGFGVGKIPFAPGTFGSLLMVLIWIGVNKFFEFEFIFWISLLISLTILGVFSAEFHSKKIGKEDAGEIVIDELCGQLLTFLIAAICIDVAKNYLLIFLGFVFFRLFDITKPFIIGLADKNVKGGLGVMLDDLLAGFAAAVLLYVVDAFIFDTSFGFFTIAFLIYGFDTFLFNPLFGFVQFILNFIKL